MKVRCYSDLCLLSTFDERFDYLKLGGEVGQDTFGFDRWINQRFYKSPEWKQIRRDIIIRDEGRDLGVEGYILKPVTKERLEKIFTRYILPAFPPTNTLNIYSNRLLFHLPVREIRYIESIGRKCIVHTANQAYETNLALNSIEQTLNSTCFVRCYRSYLVNMYYIEAVLDSEIRLVNGERIPLTLRKRSSIIQIYNEYLITHSAEK